MFVNGCYVTLKSGLIKGYYFSDEFIKENGSVAEKLAKIDEAIFKGISSMFDAVEVNKDNDFLKLKLCDVLDELFDLHVKIDNAFDNKTYRNKKDIRKYIMNYGKEQG